MVKTKNVCALLCMLVPLQSNAEEPVDFDREIRPILSRHCFHCHGPDEGNREADLRLDQRESTLKPSQNGPPIISPGDADNSELIHRLLTDDESMIMPPAESEHPLSAEQISTLRKWISSGAKYDRHWSFLAPEKTPLPTIDNLDDNDKKWIRNPIDHFVLARHAQEDLRPSKSADPAKLIRRLHLDVTGLPPSLAELRRWTKRLTKDKHERRIDDQAYLELVDHLLASEQFGERMAMFWLDAARYSDTDGFQGDSTRTNWPWRDWVVEAFNQNMPYDQFTLEQFAGDQIPNATPNQRLATCFHRNHMTNGEGGRDPEESRIDYVIDRVNTTGTIWLGLTLGCCQCHSHKYDPVSQAEYYQLFAFFNSIEEDGKAGGGAKPFMEWKSKYASRSVAEAEQWLKDKSGALDQVTHDAEVRFQRWLRDQVTAVQNGFQAWTPLIASDLHAHAGTTLRQGGDGTIQASGADPHHEDYHITASMQRLMAPQERSSNPRQFRRITGLKLEVLPDATHTKNGLSRSSSGHFILNDVKIRLRSKTRSQVRDIEIAEAHADYSADPGKNGGYGDIRHTLDDDPRNGWASFGAKLNEKRVAVFRLRKPIDLSSDDELIVELQQRALRGRHNIGRFRLLVTDQAGETPKSIEASPLELLASSQSNSADDVDEPLRRKLFHQFLADDAEHVLAKSLVDRAKAQLGQFRNASKSLKVMVLAERNERRDSHILVRGVWNKKGDSVTRGVPKAVLGWPADTEADRIALANWLTDRKNPLTARVTVNHLWGVFFGEGIVRTPEDFGVQGDRPTHPQLIDWLAVELMDSRWNIKHLIRLMLTSSTYRQSSVTSADLMKRDPANRLLARANRFRMPSWMIRDSMLAAAGLLHREVGGPPVKPYQPAGVWADITMGRFHYEPSVGPARYRRTLYAFWRRSAAPAFLFDSAKRRVCEVRTSRTNTPLHALTLLNDLTTLEASRAMAGLVMKAHRDSTDQIHEIFLRILSRVPTEKELNVVRRIQSNALSYYRSNPVEADKYNQLGQANETIGQPIPLAALSVAVAAVLNLDEAITRE